MTVKVILWTHYKKKDGTHDVKIYALNKGKKRYYSLNIQVKPENWDEARERVKGLPAFINQQYNQRIQETKHRYEQLLFDGVPADQLDIQAPSHSLLKFTAQFIQEIKDNKHDIKPASGKNYQSMLTRLKQYCEHRLIDDLSFDDITMDFYYDYRSFLEETQGKRNAFGNHIKVLKRVMRTAVERELHNNLTFDEPSFKAKKQKPGGKIYLTKDETKAIEDLDLSSMPHLDRERDRFLVAYYFMMRWEDSTKIHRGMIRGDFQFLSYTHGKTEIECTLPISPRAKAILQKRNFNFKKDSIQKANEKIKTIGSLAGINNIITIAGVTAPKFQFITSHTARRSAATQLMLQGVPLGDIMKLGGWKKLQTLQLYLRASGLDVARVAQNYDFFK
jgi:site-specific recombinase XerD